MQRGLFENKVVVLIVFVAISLIIFSSSTGRIFLSDDYCTLYNIIANNSFLLPSFFRPVGDLTLKWTYQLTGPDPFYFYLVNIILHAINSFLIYLFCRKWFEHDARVHLFSLAAGLIFLTYPSHSEAILWAIGRGVSLATFFSLMAMIVFISRIHFAVKYLLVGVFYSIALASYESALLLPIVLFALMPPSSKKQYISWSLLLLTALLVHIYLRYDFTGGIWRAYNGIIFTRDIIQYISAFVKITLRLFVPPFNYPLVFTICGVAAVAVIAILTYRNRKRFETDRLFTKTFLFCLVGLFVSILVSISFGLSTRTSEGDRLMYLPSVFYSIFIALLIVRFLSSSRFTAIALAAVLTFQVFFLLVNQEHWNRASEYAVKLINGIRGHYERPLYVINLPSDHAGAYVFRNCLKEALMFYNVDTAGVRIVNVVQSTEMQQKKELIIPEKNGDKIFIWPVTTLELKDGVVVNINGDSTTGNAIPAARFLYWNKNELTPLMK